MKKYAYLWMTICCVMMGGLSSCIDDKTTGADNPISVITIDTTQLKSVYYISKNEELVINPVIAQTNTNKELTYTWEVDQTMYSHNAELRYVGKRLGTFQARLVVSNEDGKAFYPFKISVDSPYEEGITLLSVKEDGASSLQFMPKNPENVYPNDFMDEECFSKNNDDVVFASNASDVRQCSGNLLISCQGNGQSAADVPTIYYLNEKTLVVENVITAPEYPDFVPTTLCVPSVATAGVVYPILCKNGEVYEFSTTEGAVVKSSKMTSNYAQPTAISDLFSASNYKIYLWDKTLGGLSIIMNGYGPYYCSTTYLCSKDKCTGVNNYFDGNDLVQLFVPSLTDEQRATVTPQLVALVKKGAQTQKVILSHSFWEYNNETQQTYLQDNGGKKLAGLGATVFQEGTPYVSSCTYQSLLFANGNTVRRWYYTTSQLINNSPVVTAVGSDNAVITAMALSPDHQRTYVAFYEPSESGKNGSVWEINTDTGEVIAKHANVCYRPVKMIYKRK